MSASEKKQICVLTEWPLREGWETDYLNRTLMREGIYAREITWVSLLSARPYAGDFRKISAEVLAAGKANCAQAIRSSEANVILCMGEQCLNLLCDRTGIDKWQCSVLFSDSFARKVIPCFGVERVSQDLSLQLWVSLCAKKLKEESSFPELRRLKHDFLLNPPLEETLAFLRGPASSAPTLSVDIETGRGQINTVGFAISRSQAIAINVLPDRLGAAGHWELWHAISDLLQGDQPKILQNFIYETIFFSRYGIRLRNVIHDTMICQKFLWPEFEMGLDAVGRMYSEMPYWKEDGKSWNNIRDWERHYEYNCKDTTGTFEGYLGQTRDLKERGLTDFHDNYLRRLFPAAAEMCSWGFPVSQEKLSLLQKEISHDIDAQLVSLRSELGAETLNPRSPAQVKSFLSAKGYTIPKRYDSKAKKHKESTDEKSLKKLRMKYPEDGSLSLLLKIAKLNKAQSSYLAFRPWDDQRMRYQLVVGATETGRWAGYCDPWDNGFNPQTTPGGNKGLNIKSIFETKPGFHLLECDLRQAETRFVAYDCADANLIRMLEDPTKDVHRYVAAEIFGIPESAVTKQQRQLGKKSGHGANYSMKELTFIDSCISELDLVLSRSEATKVLESYHKLFPGIRQGHANIRKELSQMRRLQTPLGRVRHFWGRLDDNTFREAYAFPPQSTIPDIVNYLMLHLMECRNQGQFDFRLLLQCHDSLLLEVPEESLCPVASTCLSTKEWHPRIDLSGGRLIIPTEVKVGSNWGNLMVWGDHETAEETAS